jgi:Leucine carboxyl methyltransferase
VTSEMKHLALVAVGILALFFVDVSGAFQLKSVREFQSFISRPFRSRLSGPTTLLVQCSSALNIAQPWNAPRSIWSLAWSLQRAVIPILHYFDKCAAKDTNLNLAVLWWKAISGNRFGSSTFDGFFAYDLLPHLTRLIVGFPFCWIYPNLHHQNVALRTAFLDLSLLHAIRSKQNVSQISTVTSTPTGVDLTPRVITLGAGFDTRSLRFQNAGDKISEKMMIADFHELDLPAVVAQKTNVFKRFLLRRPNSKMPKLYGVDLNDFEEVNRQLMKIFSEDKPSDEMSKKRPTVFMVEAVLMYLKEENVMPLLRMCMLKAAKHSSSVQLCFADRLPGMPYDVDLDVEKQAAVDLLRTVGLDLKTWQPKPGRARHMGIAEFKLA